MLADVVHKGRVHDSCFDAFKDVQEKQASSYAGILERTNCLHARLALLRSRVGPLEHLRIADSSALASF